MNWNDQESSYRDSRESTGFVTYYSTNPDAYRAPVRVDTGTRIIGYCYGFDDDQPRDCGPHCGDCNAARAAGLVVGETMEVQS